MPNEDLMRAYKNTRKLIQDEPTNKDTIINEYIDLVDKINTYETSSKSISNSTNNELGKMFKNPLEIAIYNNFQRYNDNDNDNEDSKKKKEIDSNSSKQDSTKFLANIYDLKYK
jgi:hypothetical protein